MILSIVSQIWWKCHSARPSCGEVIAMKFYTWHNSCAFMACAKFCSHMIPCDRVTTKPKFHRIWNMTETRTTRMPAFWGYPPQIFYFWNKLYTRHTFWSCLIRCANMKWIQQVLVTIQSRHDSVHRRTDGQGEISIPPFNFVEAGGIKIIGEMDPLAFHETECQLPRQLYVITKYWY